MKKILLAFSINLIAIILIPLLPYFEGRLNTVFIVPPMLPAIVALILIAVLASVLLFILWSRCFLYRKNRLFTTILIGITGISILFSHKMMAADFSKYGFKVYAKTIMSSSDWLILAQKSREIIGINKSLYGPKKNLFDKEKHQDKWLKLVSSTKIEKLGPYVSIIIRKNCTDFCWGGALVGHRSIIVCNCDNPNIASDESLVTNGIYIRFSE